MSPDKDTQTLADFAMIDIVSTVSRLTSPNEPTSLQWAENLSNKHQNSPIYLTYRQIAICFLQSSSATVQTLSKFNKQNLKPPISLP